MVKRISDEDLLIAVMTNSSQKQISKVLGVSETTISKRINTELFKKKLSEARKDIYVLTANRIVHSSMKALDVIIALLDSQSEITRLNAATKIIALTDNTIERIDILQRLDDLEKQIQNEPESSILKNT